MVGSFLNVCIYRMPLEQSVISPRSHCPNCKYSIPWLLNLPLATWLYFRGGKLAFGKEKVELAPESRIIFTETSLQLPDKELRYEEIFYRKTDYIQLQAKTVELRDRCYWNTTITLTPAELKIGEEKLNP